MTLHDRFYYIAAALPSTTAPPPGPLPTPTLLLMSPLEPGCLSTPSSIHSQCPGARLGLAPSLPLYLIAIVSLSSRNNAV